MDSKDFAIILSLIENPIATNKEIKESLQAKQAISMSEITVARRIAKLEEDDIIAGASAQLNYAKIGLDLFYYILILSPQLMKNSLILRSILSEHPYILYQNQIFGAFNGVFCQFALPASKDAIEFHRKFLDNLRDEGIILDFCEFHSKNESIAFKTQLEKFNLMSMTWDTPSNYYKAYPSTNEKFHPPPIAQSTLLELDMLDLILLRELAVNCRRSNKAIIENLKSEENVYRRYAPQILSGLPLSKQTVSRRIIALRDSGYHKSYALWYNRQTFGMFNQSLFIFDRNDVEINNLRLFIETNLPFPGGMFVAENDVLLWLNIPIVEVMKLSELISAKFERMRVCLLHRKPVTYPLWSPNYDEIKKKWKDSREYIQEPLNKLQKLNELSLDELMEEANRWVVEA